MKIKYVEGDLFKGLEKKKGTLFLAHVVNNVGVMGAGFVIPLSKHFPNVRECYLGWRAGEKGWHDLSWALGQVQFCEVRDGKSIGGPDVIVCNMMAQDDIGTERPLRYNALAQCMDKIAYKIKADTANGHLRGHYSIIAPMFGAGLAGGSWPFIEELIADCWLRNKIEVTIYYLPNTLPKNWTLPK